MFYKHLLLVVCLNGVKCNMIMSSPIGQEAALDVDKILTDFKSSFHVLAIYGIISCTFCEYCHFLT